MELKIVFFPGEHTHTLGKCLYPSVWGTLASISRHKSKYVKKVFYEIESQNFWFEKSYCGAHSEAISDKLIYVPNLGCKQAWVVSSGI